jgi:hypothetical protein
MAQRLLAFVLTLIFAAAPVTGEICEARCAGHAGHAVADEGVGSHHHHPSGSAPAAAVPHHQPVARAASNHGTTFHTVSRGCVQPDAVVTESRDVLRRPTTSAFATTIEVPVIFTSSSRSIEARRPHRPAVPARALSPLRI